MNPFTFRKVLIAVLLFFGGIGWISAPYFSADVLTVTGMNDKKGGKISGEGKLSSFLMPYRPIRLVNTTYKPGQKYIFAYTDEAVSEALSFQAVDDSNRPVAGLTVEFQIIETPSKAKGYESTSKAVTDQEGKVYPELRTGTESGTYVLIARCENQTGAVPKITVRAFDKTWILFLVFGVFGGLGIFLYGMGIGAGGLQKVAGDKMRVILGRLTRNRIMGVLLGTVVTGIVQSSSATTVMVIGFISAALMTLAQGLSVMLGAHIGTTLTVQLIAFNISDYALLMIGTGFIMTIATKRKMYIYIGEIILGFGFIFFGMGVMSTALGPLKTLPVVSEKLMYFGQNPILGILFSALFTGIVQSSGATIGLAVVLASEGLLDLTVGLPLVLGANIGTTVTGLIASSTANTEGKRAALANMLFSVIGVILMYPFIDPFNAMVVKITSFFGSDSVPRQIANSHMFFNIINAAILIWFIGFMAKAVTRMIPAKIDEAAEERKPKYLNNNLLEVPELAIEQSSREIHRIVEKVRVMFSDAYTLLGNYKEETAERLTQEMNTVYYLENEVRKYYTRLSQKSISLFQSKRIMTLLLILDDLRRIAYILGDNVNERLTQLKKQNQHFSPEGLKELEKYFLEINEVYAKTADVIEKENPDLAKEVLEHKKLLKDREVQLRQSHIERLNRGLQESIESSAVHLDVLSLLKRIDTYCNRVNLSVIEQFTYGPPKTK